MIKTTRSRLEIRQEPDRPSSLAGALLVGVGGVEAMLSLGALIAEWVLPMGRGYLAPALRMVGAGAFAAAGWFFLRGRSRVVVDLDHRMVARYLGVGGRAVGGNRSWDLAEFAAVVLVRRERRRLLKGLTSRSEIVCLRRPDGSDLEIYWTGSGGAEIASRVAEFAGLSYFGPAPG
ncbi:MAG: hypothetical protein KGM24_01620 [Elusimicrobia bacterium]|nr:hypothetical protein [Elusimicrobiota bacterium]